MLDAKTNVVRSVLHVKRTFGSNVAAGCGNALALALCYALLCGATQPLLLAQTPQASVAPEAPVAPPMIGAKPAKPTKPTKSEPSASPKQQKKAEKFFDKGTAALRKGDSVHALLWLAHAHHLVPDNAGYLANYELAKQQRVSQLLLQAKNQQHAGAQAASLKTLHLAQSIDPDSPFVRERLLATSQAMSAPPAATIHLEPMPQLDSGILHLDATTAKQSFHFRANMHDLIQRIYKAYGITTLLDESVPNTSARIDMDNMSFASASTAVQMVTKTFIVPLDPHRVLVAKDTIQNRKDFERLLVETIYLPGLDSKQMANAMNLVRNLFNVKQVSSSPANSTMSIRATEPILRAINLTLSGIYASKPEVLLDVRVYQVNDTRALVVGPQLPQTFTLFNVPSQLESLIGQVGLNSSNFAALAAILVVSGLASNSVLSQPFAMFGNGISLTGLTVSPVNINASLNTSTAKQLDHVQLRTGNMKLATFLLGSRYPITTGSMSSGFGPTAGGIPGMAGGSGLGGFAGLGANSAASSGMSALAFTPQIQYENLGLTVKATPQIYRDRRVLLKLEVKIEALAGTSINGVPTLTNQSYTSEISLSDGNSALLVSSMTRSDSTSISGIPGLSELPGMSWTAVSSPQVTIGDLVLVVTPHIVNAGPNVEASSMLLVPANEK